MILGGEQRSSGSGRHLGGASPAGHDLIQVWELLEEHPHLREVALPAAVLVDGWVSA